MNCFAIGIIVRKGRKVMIMDNYIFSLTLTEYVQIVVVGLFSIVLAGLFNELHRREKEKKNNEEITEKD